MKTSKINSYLKVDTQIDIFINPQLVIDIKRINQVIHISTNVGSKIIQMKAMVPDYGKVCYNDKGIMNILSLADLVKKYRVTYDSHQDYFFTVHTNRGIIKFSRNKQGQYVFKPTYTTKKIKCCHNSGIKYGGIHTQTNREFQVR